MKWQRVLLLSLVFCSGCVGREDPEVKRAIQTRSDQQDGAYGSRDVNAITAFCALDYSEVNAGPVSVRPKNWNTVAVSRRARRKANQEEIASLAEYRSFLAEQFEGVQNMSVQSTVLSAKVNRGNDQADVTVSREIRAMAPFPGSQRAVPLLVRQSLDETWVKRPGGNWLKRSSEVTMSNTQRDRMAEAE